VAGRQKNSNQAIAKNFARCIGAEWTSQGDISLLPDSSREGVAKLIKEDKFVDLIVPRGWRGAYKFISENAQFPSG